MRRGSEASEMVGELGRISPLTQWLVVQEPEVCRQVSHAEVKSLSVVKAGRPRENG